MSECYAVDCGRPGVQVRPVRGKGQLFCDLHARKRDHGIKRAVILEGHPFDWEEGARAAKHAIDDDGQVNWKAAFCADPGVVSCPACGVSHWREGTRVRCAMEDCKHEWPL